MQASIGTLMPLKMKRGLNEMWYSGLDARTSASAFFCLKDIGGNNEL